MAKKSSKKVNRRARRIVLLALLTLLVLFGAVIGVAALNANTLHVRRAEVAVEHLPAGFEGKTVLYLSDIDLCGLNTARKAAGAVNRLQALRPDLLVLGGDYNSISLLEQLNRTDRGIVNQQRLEERRDFFLCIKDFVAPLGKYAIASPEDQDLPALAASMRESGFTVLTDAIARVESGGDALLLAGLTSGLGAINAQADRIDRNDCLVAVCSTPALFPALMTLEAPGGGHIADLALAGRTHGGQLRLFGRNALALTMQEQQYLYGWTRESGVPMLTTSGLGCEGVNLRLGTQAEAWLITLRGQTDGEIPAVIGN